MMKSKRLKKTKKKFALRTEKRKVKQMKKIELVSAVWREGKYYVAQCLNVDISSFGKTKAIALANLREALELYLEDVPASRISKIQQPGIQTQELMHA
jgi:predicted RNase H-like HicB family nuclease